MYKYSYNYSYKIDKHDDRKLGNEGKKKNPLILT